MIANKFVIIIVNSIPPYCFELNNILSLPDDFTYRFRYQKKKQGNWMPEISNPYDLKGNEGLIVLRDFQKSAGFIPIRKIFIDKILVIGDIVYIEYKLKEKVELSSDQDERDSQLETFNQRIATDINFAKYPNLAGVDLKNLVFFGNDHTRDITDTHFKGPDQDRDSNRWGNIVETIGLYRGSGLEVYKDSDFLKIIGLEDEQGNAAPLIKENGQAIYRVKNKKLYKLLFLQRTFTGKSKQGDSSVQSPRRIQLKTGNPDINPIISQREILGKYDLMELTFQANINSPIKSHLLLEISEAGPARLPTINIPVKVVLSMTQFWLSLASIFLFIVSFLAYTYMPELVEKFNAAIPPELLTVEVTRGRNIFLPLMIIFGGNVFKQFHTIKEALIGRINP